MIQDEHIVRQAADADHGRAQRNGMNLWQDLLRGAAAIVEGQRDQCTMLVTDTEDVAARERFAERFVAGDMAALIEQTVEGAAARRVRMDDEGLIALENDLRVET